MTQLIENPKHKTKAKLTIADRLILARDRAVAKVPKEDWEAIPKDASSRLEEYTEGKI